MEIKTNDVARNHNQIQAIRPPISGEKIFQFPHLTEGILKGVDFTDGDIHTNKDNTRYSYILKLTKPVDSDRFISNMEEFLATTLQSKKFEGGFISRHLYLCNSDSFLSEVIVDNTAMKIILEVHRLPNPYDWKGLDYYKILPADLDKAWKELRGDFADEVYKEVEDSLNCHTNSL
jgi:hypothetical protein